MIDDEKGKQEMSINAIKAIRERIVKAGGELHDHGLVKVNSGNLSAKIPAQIRF